MILVNFLDLRVNLRLDNALLEFMKFGSDKKLFFYYVFIISY